MSASPSSSDLVAQVDHLLIFSDDADALLALFAETFALPAFPMSVQGTFESGLITAGNVFLEFLRHGAQAIIGPLPPGAAQVRGIALYPAGEVAASLAQLDARGIAHTEPTMSTPMFANVGLPGLIPRCMTFLCHYGPAVHERRNHLMQQLRERDGGLLGIEGVREVVVGVNEMAAATERWQRLLAPAQPSGAGCWSLGAGPAIRLEGAEVSGIRQIVFRVRDLERTATALAQHQLLGERTEQTVLLDPDRVQTLQFAFTAHVP